jgi:hypothetical protein
MKPAFLSWLSLTALLTACSGGSPPVREALPPGADKQVGASSQLPPPPANQSYDASIAPADDTRGARIGSAVEAQGGQKAQKEKEERAQAEAQARRNREREQEARQGQEPGADTAPAPAPAQ